MVMRKALKHVSVFYLDGIFGPNTSTSSQLACQHSWESIAPVSVRGHGFKSRTGLNFFQVLFSTTCFSSVLSCEDLLIS